MSSLPKFLTRIQNKVICNVYELHLYIPKEFFEESYDLSNVVGNKLNTLGVFYCSYKESENGKESNYYLLNFPNKITIEFSEEDSLTLKLPSDDDEQPYKVYTLKKGDTFLENEFSIKSTDNLEFFFGLLFSGKLPKTSYEDIYNQLSNLQEENSIDLGVNTSIIELMISELTRYNKDKMIPFRKALAKGANKGDYIGVNIKLLPSFTSSFAGVSFENMDQSLLFAIDNERNGKPERITPTEESIYL